VRAIPACANGEIAHSIPVELRDMP
jgi:RNA polymerase sigma factor (sigma-70 family)